MLKKLLIILVFASTSWIIIGMMISGSLVTPFSKHWVQGESTEGWLHPNQLFVIVCTNQQTGKNAKIDNLDMLRITKEHSDSNHPCAKNASFRLTQSSYSGDDLQEHEETLSFQVTNDQDKQIVEIDYTDDNVISGWFKYQVKDEQITPLESSVQSSFHILALLFYGIGNLLFAIVILNN